MSATPVEKFGKDHWSIFAGFSLEQEASFRPSTPKP